MLNFNGVFVYNLIDRRENMMNEYEKIDIFESFLKYQNYKNAEKLILSAENLCEALLFVNKSLCMRREIPSSIIQSALLTYEKKYTNMGEDRVLWVRSLDSFLRVLWFFRLTDNIKRLYKIAFQGVREHGDTRYCYKLIKHFVKNARWDDFSGDYYISKKNTPWVWDMSEGRLKKNLSRVEVRPFVCEGDYLLWAIRDNGGLLKHKLDHLKKVNDQESMNLAIEKELKFWIQKLDTKSKKIESDNDHKIFLVDFVKKLRMALLSLKK
jgi:hypothetical protein